VIEMTNEEEGRIPALYQIFTYYIRGKAWHGLARQGLAWQGQQELRSCFMLNYHKSITNYTQGAAGSGWAVQGWAGHGKARAQGFKTLCIMRKK
jgi:hypothetical protein